MNRISLASISRFVAPLLLIGVCAACGGLDRIDRRIEREVRIRTGMLGDTDLAPRLAQRDVPEDGADVGREKQPETTNPTPSELAFEVDEPADTPRDEAERIAARLDDRQALAAPDEAVVLDLIGILEQAHETAPEFIRSEEEYILDAIDLLVERHLWGPRFFNTTSATFNGSQTDGSSDSALRVINQLRATQRLPYGGEVEARWVWEATENLRSSATGQYVQASTLSLDASIPLLRGAGLVAQEGLIQAERNLIYSARRFERSRRELLVDIANDFFSLLQQRAGLRNQACQLESFLSLADRQERLYDAGRIPEYEVNIARNNVLTARSRLTNQRESYILRLDNFKVRLGMPVESPLRLRDVRFNLPEPMTTLADATANALDFRLDLQTERDQLADTRRAVANARNQMLPDLDVTGSASLRTDADEREGGVVFEPDDAAYSAGIILDLPLDREIERLRVREAIVRDQRARRDFEVFRDQLVLDVRARVREIDRAKFALLLAEESVRITRRRQREQTIRAELGEITTQERIDTLNELLDAENARDQAETDLRSAVLEYLLSTGQMRVTRGGLLDALPGMPVDLIEPDETDDLSFDCPVREEPDA